MAFVDCVCLIGVAWCDLFDVSCSCVDVCCVVCCVLLVMLLFDASFFCSVLGVVCCVFIVSAGCLSLFVVWCVL